MRISSSVRRRGVKLLLLVASVVLVLVGAELALTLFYPTEYLRPPDKTSDDLFKEVLHRPSTVPGLAFELTPNRQRKIEGIWIRTNNQGMRDSEPVPIEDDSVSRILAIGDSFTFGFRVDVDSAYPNVLEARLNQAATGRRFEVLNLGVSAYNTQDEAVVLEHKGLPWRPDLVILAYVLNDPETDPVQPLNSYFREPAVWQRFNLARLAAKAKHGLEVMLWGKGDYYFYLHAEGREKWNSVVSAFDDIRRLSESQQVPVLVVIFPDRPNRRWSDYPYAEIHAQVAEISRASGFAVIDLLDRFSEYPARQMRVRFGDPHPSPMGHQVAAEAIYDWIATELLDTDVTFPQLTPSS